MTSTAKPKGKSKVVWLIVAGVLAPVVLLVCVCIIGIVVGFFWKGALPGAPHGSREPALHDNPR